MRRASYVSPLAPLTDSGDWTQLVLPRINLVPDELHVVQPLRNNSIKDSALSGYE